MHNMYYYRDSHSKLSQLRVVQLLIFGICKENVRSL